MLRESSFPANKVKPIKTTGTKREKERWTGKERERKGKGRTARGRGKGSEQWKSQ